MKAMSNLSLRLYAESRIKELGLGVTPTNCNGVVVYNVPDFPDAVRLADGIALEEECWNRQQVDEALQCIVDA